MPGPAPGSPPGTPAPGSPPGTPAPGSPPGKNRKRKLNPNPNTIPQAKPQAKPQAVNNPTNVQVTSFGIVNYTKLIESLNDVQTKKNQKTTIQQHMHLRCSQRAAATHAAHVPVVPEHMPKQKQQKLANALSLLHSDKSILQHLKIKGSIRR